MASLNPVDTMRETLADFSKVQANYSHIVDESSIVSPVDLIDRIATYYDDIIGCMPGNVYWLDKNGVTVGCNKNVLAMFNLPSVDKFKGMTFEDMKMVGGWSDAATQSFKRDTLAVVNTGQPKLNIEEPPIPHASGKTVYFLTSRVPLFNRAGEVIGVVGISIDITERKQMEVALLKAKEEAEAANKLKIDFIHNMEHDIRTPFNGIYGIAKHLYSIEEDALKKDFLNDIINCSKELLDYSTGILDFSMLESKSLPLMAKKFDMRRLVDGVIAMETPPARLKNLRLCVEYNKEVPKIVIGDRYRLQRVLINLISNAIKFTEQGSIVVTVSLASQTNARNIVLSFKIEDTGMGIPKEKQNLLYEKFVRLTPSNQGVYTGKGLGLRLVKQFVEEMEGEIDVTSKVDKGTTFLCSFPFKVPLVEGLLDASDAE